MINDGRYTGSVSFQNYNGEAVIKIGSEQLEFQAQSKMFTLNYAEIKSFCLRNYHFSFETPSGTLELSQMGHDTEGFYEELWSAYNQRSRESLFVESSPFMETEGEYSYTDDGGCSKGTAKISLHLTEVCILPPDCGARRIPLCFIRNIELDNYTIRITLDTDEHYDLIRLGHDTVPFYECLDKFRKAAQKQWKDAFSSLGANLETRLGEAVDRYRFLKEICGNEHTIYGLFAPESNEFWISAFRGSSIAVELISVEKSATYLYRMNGDFKTFENRLRHAMEAMGLHREILFMEEEALKTNPLYSMTEERNAHLRFLRSCMSGRVIHTDNWKSKLSESLK